jgi:hypothetical protein
MPLLDARGKLFGKINVLDGAIVLAALVGVVGVVAVKSGHTSIMHLVEKQGPTQVTLMIRANIEDLSIFKKGDKAFVTIRNVPYDKVEITTVEAHRTQIAVPTHDGTAFRVANDPTTPYSSEVTLTLTGPGLETEDGITWGSQKLKVGVPIDIEGFKYRLRGSVLDVRMLDTPAASSAQGVKG